MFKPFWSTGDIYVATGQDAIQLSFEQRGVEIYLAPGAANGLGEILQRAAASMGVMPIGGQRTDESRERFIRELEQIYEQFHQENGT